MTNQTKSSSFNRTLLGSLLWAFIRAEKTFRGIIVANWYLKINNKTSHTRSQTITRRRRKRRRNMKIELGLKTWSLPAWYLLVSLIYWYLFLFHHLFGPGKIYHPIRPIFLLQNKSFMTIDRQIYRLSFSFWIILKR